MELKVSNYHPKIVNGNNLVDIVQSIYHVYHTLF